MPVLKLAAFWLSLAQLGAAVPLTITQSHVLVDEVYLDGAGPFRFVLDTGAQTSSLRTDVARQLGMQPSYRVEVASVGGRRYIPAGVIGKVTLGSQSALGVEMIIHNLDAMRLLDSRIHGVLGQNYLARFDYLLDLRAHRLSFDEPGAHLKGTGPRLPFDRVSDRMLLRTGGMALVLDSGTGDLVLFQNRQNLEDTGLSACAEAVTAAPSVRVTRLPLLQVGGRTFKNVRTAVIPEAHLDSDGLLPLTLFDSVYVNNRSGYVVVR